MIYIPCFYTFAPKSPKFLTHILGQPRLTSVQSTLHHFARPLMHRDFLYVSLLSVEIDNGRKTRFKTENNKALLFYVVGNLFLKNLLCAILDTCIVFSFNSCGLTVTLSADFCYVRLFRKLFSSPSFSLVSLIPLKFVHHQEMSI